MDKRVKLTLLIRQQLIVLLLSSSLWAQDNQLAEAEPNILQATKIAIIEFGTQISPVEISPLSESIFFRKLDRAKNLGVDLIVLEIDSPGGYIDSSIKIASALRDLDWASTVAYIPREALSGAAIISLGCDEIVMGKNAFIGDAGPIFMGEDFLFRHAPEKVRSDLVSKVRALSEAKGRPPAIAEAMVDMDLEVFKVTHADDARVSYMSDAELNALEDPTEWLKGPLLEPSKKGQFLEVAGAEAVEIGLADTIVDSRERLAARYGVATDSVVVLDSSWIDTLVTVLNFRAVTVLLLIVGLVAIYFELAAPGLGVGGLVGTLCFGIFFWSRFLGGTSGWLEVILFVAGISFLLVEIFVIPGFGVAGLGGVLLIGLSVLMAGQRFGAADGVSTQEIVASVMMLCGAALGSLAGLFFVTKYFGDIAVLKRFKLEPPVPETAAASSLASQGRRESPPLAVGDEGIADSALRPSGRVRFGEEFHDVVSEGSFIEKGTPVRIVKLRGTIVTVRAV